MADAGLAAANLKQAYVSNSRFAARSAMARPGKRLLTLEKDTIPADLASARRTFLSELYAQGVPAGADLLRGWVDASAKTGEALASGNSG